MASNTTTVAHPYAQAIFNIAKMDDNTLNAWNNCLVLAKDIITNQEFVSLYANPKVDKADLVKCVMSVIPDAPKYFSEFIGLLVKAKRLCFFEQIYDLFLEQKALYTSSVSAVIESVVALRDQDKDALAHKITTHFKKKHVDIVNALNPDLIGGIKITVDDWVLDLSIKRRLERLGLDA